MLIISCHADTGFMFHSCEKTDKEYIGHMDNFSGVYAVMKAYFSGKLNKDFVKIELTYDEEGEFEGAYEVLSRIRQQDIVIVVDVTATPTKGDFVFEKCQDKSIRKWIQESLTDYNFDIYKHCPDPVSDEDETDVYREKIDRVFFMGIPCRGGDYNEEKVRVSKSSIDEVAKAICTLVNSFPDYCRNQEISEY